MGFIDAIVSPLFSVVCEFFPGMSFTLDNMKINREYYKNEVDKKNNKKDEIKEDKEKEESDKDEKSESASDKEN